MQKNNLFSHFWQWLNYEHLPSEKSQIDSDNKLIKELYSLIISHVNVGGDPDLIKIL